jgi:hypothetical protein
VIGFTNPSWRIYPSVISVHTTTGSGHSGFDFNIQYCIEFVLQHPPDIPYNPEYTVTMKTLAGHFTVGIYALINKLMSAVFPRGQGGRIQTFV